MQVPVLYKDESECCGCAACYSVCVQHAIAMVKDRNGFEYPHIDTAKCIGCLSCVRVCPFKMSSIE